MLFEYSPPLIRHISDVLPHIEGDTTFVVIDKDAYTVIDYVVTDENTHPPVMHEEDLTPKIKRECRGLIFDRNGILVSRPMEKFFNMNEKDWTQAWQLPMESLSAYAVKEDGSMVRPLRITEGKDDWRLATRKGITDKAQEAEVLMGGFYPEVRNAYYRLFRFCEQQNITPVFEFVGPDNKIVVEYNEAALVLIAARNTFTGVYVDLHRLVAEAGAFGVRVVDFHWSCNLDEAAPDHDLMVDHVRKSTTDEGIIMIFGSPEKGVQQRIKVKSDWYVSLHRIKSELGQPRQFVKLVRAGALDDVEAALSPEQRNTLQEGEQFFWEHLRGAVKTIRDVRDELDIRGFDRKTFALSEEFNARLGPIMKSLVFKIWDDPTSAEQVVNDFLDRNCETNKSFAKVEELLRINPSSWPRL